MNATFLFLPAFLVAVGYCVVCCVANERSVMDFIKYEASTSRCLRCDLRTNRRKTEVKELTKMRQMRNQKLIKNKPTHGSMIDKSRSYYMRKRRKSSGFQRNVVKHRKASQKNKRNTLRPLLNVTLAENSTGTLFKLPKLHPEERFELLGGDKDLHVHSVIGGVSLREGKRLDFESRPTFTLTFAVTRPSDLFCEFTFFNFIILFLFITLFWFLIYIF